jgi:serine/threonine-protein kinase
VLGPYILTDALGAGSMGTVYKAVSKTDGKDYAIKVLPRRSMWNVRLARRQVRSFGQFSHSAVVPFVDVGTSGGTHYLVWPLVQGETLEVVVGRLGRLSPEQTAQVGVQVASALVVCHGQGLFHGLLKPSNIMIGAGFQVAILDFGIGCLLAENEGESLVDTMSTSNTLTSGLDCASPESIMEPTNRTPAGDQYSLGCILYYCVTGKYPFADGSAVEKMVAHQFKQPTPVKDLAAAAPDELVAVIDRLMQKKPADRFNGADEAADRLLPLTAGRPVDGGFAAAAPAAAAPAMYAPQPGSFIQPQAPGSRPLSFLLPPPGAVAAQAASSAPSRKSVPPRPATPAASVAADRMYQEAVAASREFVMPPGYVPEKSRGAQFGPLAVAAVGIGAMIVSYLAFLTYNPFR